jgi:uracil-DNA glycosylase family protein
MGRESATAAGAPGKGRIVPGVGPKPALLMLVGEQPGDEEDRQGRPFVGPAGALLDQLLAEAGIDRKQVYVTNAVKRFNYVVRGKRRLHQKPSAREVAASKAELLEEIQRVRPRVVVALGATAASALFGSAVRVLRDRGRTLPTPHAAFGFVTYHPSAALRGPTPEDRAEIRRALAADLQLAVEQARVTDAGLPIAGGPAL